MNKCFNNVPGTEKMLFVLTVIKSPTGQVLRMVVEIRNLVLLIVMSCLPLNLVLDESSKGVHGTVGVG